MGETRCSYKPGLQSVINSRRWSPKSEAGIGGTWVWGFAVLPARLWEWCCGAAWVDGVWVDGIWVDGVWVDGVRTDGACLWVIGDWVKGCVWSGVWARAWACA